MPDHLDDVKKLLERIWNNVNGSQISDGDKKYIKELIQLANEKVDIVRGETNVENSN